MLEIVKRNLEASIPPKLVEKLLEAYEELRVNDYLGKIRIHEVEGGRFAEAVFRILEHRTTGAHTPLGRSVDSEKIILNLANINPSRELDSVRLYIPRTLRVIYDIRNNRDAAHLADGIDPNKQDASIVLACSNWILAELIRIYHSVSADEAQAIVNNLIEKRVPAIQEFNGFLKTLNPTWTIKDRILAILYHRGSQGATRKELSGWLKPSQRTNLSKALYELDHEEDFIYRDKERCYITSLGDKEVENRKLLSF